MTAKEYLHNLEVYNIKITQKRSELTALRNTADCVRGVSYSEEASHHGSAKGEASYEAVTDTMTELESEIKREIDVFVAKRHEIINQIQGLDDCRYINILYKRYVEMKRLEAVSVEMNYTYQYAVELHGYALKAFETAYSNLLKTYVG